MRTILDNNILHTLNISTNYTTLCTSAQICTQLCTTIQNYTDLCSVYNAWHIFQTFAKHWQSFENIFHNLIKQSFSPKNENSKTLPFNYKQTKTNATFATVILVWPYTYTNLHHSTQLHNRSTQLYNALHDICKKLYNTVTNNLRKSTTFYTTIHKLYTT